MKKNNDRRSSWLDFLALVLSFFGVIVSIVGAFITFSSQAQIAETRLWPLPGFVLLDWVILGLIGLLTAYICIQQSSAKWLRVTWFATGSLIPLIILGGFSIGPFVLIAFLLFVISTMILAIRNRAKWLESFGQLLLGAIVNLIVLLTIIFLGNRG
jgi:hypothetical protein